MIDYKIHRIVREPDGSTEVFLRLYEGAVTTEDELDSENVLVPVTSYRRTKMTGERKVYFKGDVAPTREQREDYLRYYLNGKMTTETGDVIPEQVNTAQQDTDLAKQELSNESYELL